MHTKAIAFTILFAAMMVLSALPAAADEQAETQLTTEPATQAATQPAVPADVLKRMEAFYRRPQRQMDMPELLALLRDRMGQVLAMGEQAERDYPKAANLHEVWDRMLPAADFLERQEPGEASRQPLRQIAEKLKASNAPTESKVRADFILTRLTVEPLPGQPAPADAAKRIEAFAKHHEADPEAAALAIRFALDLTEGEKLAALRQQLMDRLAEKYGDDFESRVFLQRNGWFDGKPFEATLKRLDGSTMKLPDDLLGKVVVIDFWATWCVPCRMFTPELQRVYNAYRDRGLEIVSISIDKAPDREKVHQAIEEDPMPWLHAFSGKGGQDPTAVHYGVAAIPSIWVVGRDGKVVSSDARATLDSVIAEALKAPAGTTTKPAE